MVAEISCIKLGGHLVSIHDAIIDALLAQEGGNHFHESTISDLWIGLTGMTPTGNWTWMDGTPLDFEEWAIGEPKNITGNNCAALSINDGFWRSESCFTTKPYICNVEKSSFEPSPTTPTIPASTLPSKYPIYANCSFPFIYFEPSHSCYGHSEGIYLQFIRMKKHNFWDIMSTFQTQIFGLAHFQMMAD
uniref:C-type lectin domain-containing protein n=1 Tax=Panagrolaimus superbus TaxID=310955 RepID=A0A914Y9Z5_9BILA